MNGTEEITLAQINDRLARLEELLTRLVTRYEPMLLEAARRMEGPMRWRAKRG